MSFMKRKLSFFNTSLGAPNEVQRPGGSLRIETFIWQDGRKERKLQRPRRVAED